MSNPLAIYVAEPGRTAVRLASRGIKTFAIDLSPDMCRIAREKTRKAGLKVKVIRSDMRDFRLPQPVDLVTCECDGMNHIPRKQDLQRVAKSVARALQPGGYFAFDVNNRQAFERIWSKTWFFDKDPVAMVMHGEHEPGTDKAWTDVEWFVREGKSWKRYQRACRGSLLDRRRDPRSADGCRLRSNPLLGRGAVFQ